MNIPTPRFNIKDNVFVFQFGKLKQKVVKNIIIRIQATTSEVLYNFELTNDWGFLLELDGTNESEVFADKEDFMNKIEVA